MKSYYRVKRGETLLSVSEDLLIAPFKLISDNCLSSEVREGQVLIIDKLERPLYRVKPFDNVNSVCQKFSITKEDFLLYNNIVKVII